MAYAVKLTLAAAALAAVAGLGCSSDSYREPAEVAPPPPPAVETGWHAPELRFLDRDGYARSISALYGDATLVFFKSGHCLGPDRDLENIARVSRGSIAVIQVCDSAPGCDPNGGLEEVSFATEPSMRILCDSDRRLRDAYDVYDQDTVFVLDSLGVVRDSGFRSELDRLQIRAEELDAEADHLRDEHGSGG